MRIFTRVEISRHGKFAGVHSYSFSRSVDDDYENAPVKIRLVCESGQMDIDAEDLSVLCRAIELFKKGESV
jgi:hypothetical protein